MLLLHQVILACLACTILAAKLPSKFKTCRRSDPAFVDCLKVAIQDSLPLVANGLPELGVVPIGPLTIPTATIGEGKGAVNVVQKYSDFKIHHLDETKIEKIESTMTPKSNTYEWIVQASSPEYIIDADYDFNGRVLLLPIVGKGKCLLTLKDVKIVIRLNFEKFEKNGKTYTKAKECTMELNPGKVTYHFDNLFNGDERLGKEMNNILNDNWKEVFDDIKPGYEELIATVIQNIANNLFTKIPFDELHPK